MDYQLRGKRAFVTAGAHGIGEAIADLLTQEGVAVTVADLDADALAEKPRRWANTVAADLATASGVAQALDALGDPPDILVNNLGLGNAAVFEAMNSSHTFATLGGDRDEGVLRDALSSALLSTKASRKIAGAAVKPDCTSARLLGTAVAARRQSSGKAQGRANLPSRSSSPYIRAVVQFAPPFRPFGVEGAIARHPLYSE
jgi:NAD(P)-dependent dehydrogenase (short-subunit alcohol dehydrogenase family)